MFPALLGLVTLVHYVQERLELGTMNGDCDNPARSLSTAAAVQQQPQGAGIWKRTILICFDVFGGLVT